MTDPQFRLLGPVEAVHAGRTITVAGRGKIVLAALLLQANSTVSRQELVDAVWEAELPANPYAALQTTVSRLRTALEPGRDLISTEPNGYRISVGTDQLDLLGFRLNLEEAERQRDPARRVALLTEGLNLWRGDPLGGLPFCALVRDNAPALVEERLRAIELLMADQLELGRHADIVPELTALVRRYPARERLAAVLMTAQYRSGHQVLALDVYQQIRTHLADEFGVDPGVELQRLHAEVLARSDPSPRPQQLPTDIDRFTGRVADLDVLDAFLPNTTGLPNTAGTGHPPIVIAAVDGAAGIGKTALAVHWAHRIRDRFPDGQLYLNLRGHGPGQPVEPSAAVEAMLRSLGIAENQIPGDLDDRSALLRTVLAGKRMLVLLDNARDAGQVRPLLPGSGSLVLITSRAQLRGLAVREGASRLTLDHLPTTEAIQLLTSIIGDRARKDQEAVSELARYCNGLPLALVIAAERATRSPSTALHDLVEDLADERVRLNFLGGGDDVTADLRSVFSWSYQALSVELAGLLRLLAIFPGGDIGVPAAAALAGMAPARINRLLDQLVATNQLQNRQPGRYELHDLLRAYATELAQEHDPEPQRVAALRRVTEWYLHTAANARTWLQPAESDITLPASTVLPQTFLDARLALTWFEAERHNLVAVASLAYDYGFDDLCWRLGYVTLIGLHVLNGWDEALAIHEVGIRATERCGDRIGTAHMRSGMGSAYRCLGRLDLSIENQQEALRIFLSLGDQAGEATAQSNLCAACRDAGRYDEALAYGYAAQALDRQSGEPGNSAISTTQIALTLIAADRCAEAVTVATESLELFRKVGHGRGQARALHALAIAQGRLGRHQTAIDAAQSALDILVEIGDRANQASAFQQLGDMYLAAGRHEEAAASWREALTILEDLGDPAAADLRSRLSGR